ncbi:hypothetical protein TREES_T100001716 [Tupaia chinensis]|uniref:Uncharacterized protein n=1 Tax=Tupaia chinensis TaxID=246437 RepID=L9KJL1_TUPCH|nr:hypothetical protein TREES_T100001716 [Tupaia chinensis]
MLCQGSPPERASWCCHTDDSDDSDDDMTVTAIAATVEVTVEGPRNAGWALLCRTLLICPPCLLFCLSVLRVLRPAGRRHGAQTVLPESWKPRSRPGRPWLCLRDIELATAPSFPTALQAGPGHSELGALCRSLPADLAAPPGQVTQLGQAARMSREPGLGIRQPVRGHWPRLCPCDLHQGLSLLTRKMGHGGTSPGSPVRHAQPRQHAVIPRRLWLCQEKAGHFDGQLLRTLAPWRKGRIVVLSARRGGVVQVHRQPW